MPVCPSSSRHAPIYTTISTEIRSMRQYGGKRQVSSEVAVHVIRTELVATRRWPQRDSRPGSPTAAHAVMCLLRSWSHSDLVPIHFGCAKALLDHKQNTSVDHNPQTRSLPVVRLLSHLVAVPHPLEYHNDTDCDGKATCGHFKLVRCFLIIT